MMENNNNAVGLDYWNLKVNNGGIITMSGDVVTAFSLIEMIA